MVHSWISGSRRSAIHFDKVKVITFAFVSLSKWFSTNFAEIISSVIVSEIRSVFVAASRSQSRRLVALGTHTLLNLQPRSDLFLLIKFWGFFLKSSLLEALFLEVGPIKSERSLLKSPGQRLERIRRALGFTWADESTA